MPETQPQTKEVVLLPGDLHQFWARARASTFASGQEPIPGLITVGSKGFRFEEEESDYFYTNEYFDHSKRPGNFAGIEIIRKYRFDGPKVAVYTYGGGLTGEGLKIGKELVYEMLKRFLRQDSSSIHFGEKIAIQLKNESGVWIYQNNGEIRSWGWLDREKMFLNLRLVHQLNGTGVCFVPNFNPQD